MTIPAPGSTVAIDPRRALDALKRAAPVELIAYALTALAFVVLFAKPATLMFDAWWNDPNSGHGLLLAPLSLFFAWRSGISPKAKAQPVLGVSILLFAVLSRYAADLAAELFVMRGSMLVALAGLVVFHSGWRQLVHWWLPFTLTALSIPIPEVILNTVALPLQFTASKIGASLLRWRDIPVQLTGNVIRIPRQELFVAEACSGLRSLTALISLGVLIGAMFLQAWPSRVALVALSVPVAILINGFRIFLTGFLVLYVSPKAGEGFMHESEGMLTFGGAFLLIGLIAWGLGKTERFTSRMFARSVT